MFHGRQRVFILWVADICCVDALLLLTAWLYQAVGLGHYKFGVSFYLNLWPAGLLFSGVNFLFSLYQGSAFYPSAPVSPVEELRRLVASAVLTHLGILAYLAISRQTTEGYSRAVILVSGTLSAFLAQPVRNLVRSVLFRWGIAQIPVYLAGGGEAERLIKQAIAHDSYTGFRILRTFPGDFRQIVRCAREEGVKILLVCQDIRLFKTQLEELTTWFTFIEYFPTAASFPVYGARPVVVDSVGGFEMVNQRRMRWMRAEKTVLDFALSLLALLAFLPFFALIPVLVKVTSPGPVFYRAKRLGRNGREIRVWKFRSMYADADKRLDSLLAGNPQLKAEFEANFKLANDPRVTPLGRFLRKTSLDEIPQLFNVFSGEMALIGPRPIVTAEIPHYGENYTVVSSVKPGITGLWQASGRSATDYTRRVALDMHYVLNWSPWLDLWILLRTVDAVLFMRGAC